MQKILLHIHFDEASRSFWADSPELDGLIVSGQTPAEVLREARAAAAALLQLGGQDPHFELRHELLELEPA